MKFFSFSANILNSYLTVVSKSAKFFGYNVYESHKWISIKWYTHSWHFLVISVVEIAKRFKYHWCFIDLSVIKQAAVFHAWSSYETNELKTDWLWTLLPPFISWFTIDIAEAGTKSEEQRKGNRQLPFFFLV